MAGLSGNPHNVGESVRDFPRYDYESPDVVALVARNLIDRKSNLKPKDILPQLQEYSIGLANNMDIWPPEMWEDAASYCGPAGHKLLPRDRVFEEDKETNRVPMMIGMNVNGVSNILCHDRRAFSFIIARCSLNMIF